MYIKTSIYYQKSIETINIIADKLKTMTFSYHKLLFLSKFSEDELKSRIEILEIKSESKDDLMIRINKKIKEYKNIIEKLS